MSENVVGESHHQWKDGDVPYRGKWWAVREAALKRDQYRCANCGKTAADIGRAPDVHHLEPVREFDDPQDAHRLDNVISLCRACHQRVEAGAVAPPVSQAEE